MSAFRPKDFAEAKATFKPMKRSRLAVKKPMSRKSKKKISKDKAWKEFSIFIRTRGADAQGFNTCVTCEARKFWRDLQAGHFIAGRLNSNLFDERGCHPQCYSCNVGKHGNGVQYYRFMQRQFGEDVISELIEQNNQTRKWSAGELARIYYRYNALNSTNPLVSMGSDS